MKANRKRLKADLASGVRKLSPASVAPKLGEFPLFDEFFPDLADFRELDVFWLFDFPDFLACSIPPPNPSISPLPLFLPEAGLLLLFLLEADLMLSFLLGAGSLVVFNIKVSRASILLKP